MSIRGLLAMTALLSSVAHSQNSPSVPTPPSQAPKPAASLQAPTNSVPKAPSTGSGMDASTALSATEAGVNRATEAFEDAAKRNAPGARSAAMASRVAGNVLGVTNLVITGAETWSSVSRAHQCAKKGDLDGVDRAMAETEYNVLGLHPIIGAAQLCGSLIGELLFDDSDAVKDVVVSMWAAQAKRERELNAQGFYVPPHLFAYGESPYHYWIPPEDGRRSAAHQTVVEGNRQATASRAATAAQSSGYDYGMAPHLMFMWMPAVVSASQSQAPRRAPAPTAPAAPPVRCLEGQVYEYVNGVATPCPNYPPPWMRADTAPAGRFYDPNQYRDGRRLDTNAPPTSTPGRSGGRGCNNSNGCPGHR